jgi:hypothetical protein
LFLPALGGSSVPPAYLALCFLIARLTLPGAYRTGALVDAARTNFFLVIFVAYGATTALILPRIFAGAINIVPLRATKLDFLLQTFPLEYTSQNVTTAVYLVGTLLAGLAATAIGRSNAAPQVLVKWGTVIAGIHVYLGFSGALLDGTAYAVVLDAFRNGAYAQLDHSFDGMSRMKGIMPEASSYASYAFLWFAFHFECWIRNVLPRWTGPAAAALGAALIFSTSSTAYVALAGYSVILTLRCLAVPSTVTLDKLFTIFAVSWIVATAGVAVLAMSPATATRFSNMILHMTIDKADSTSGIQRAFWAKQGFQALVVSKGLGIGAGSFRSSSLITAIIGSMGVVGILAYLCQLFNVLKPLRNSTYVNPPDLRSRVGAALSWTVVMMLIPAGIGAASPNPGADFAILGGLALAFRGAKVPRFLTRKPAQPLSNTDFAMAAPMPPSSA